jgi:hypothetical protein
MLLTILCLRAQHLLLNLASEQTSADPELYTRVRAMVSNRDKWDVGTRHTLLLPLFSSVLGKTLPEGWMPPEEEFADLVSASTCNHFSMWLPDYSSFGTVVDPQAALMNHSCVPNVCRTTSAGQFCQRFVALRDIKMGEPTTWSYLPSDVCFEERRQITKEHYCFECACSRCKGQQGGDLQGGEEQDHPRTTACPCGGWMYKNDGILICSICMQPNDGLSPRGDDDDSDEDNFEEDDWEDGGEESIDESDDEVLPHTAGTPCECGGWTFRSDDRWLCVHCDREL